MTNREGAGAMKQIKVSVQQDPEEIIEKNVLAKAIVNIAKAFNKLSVSGLNERAIVCLVHDACGVGKPDVRAVLASLKTLERDFCQ
jgi:hypothetical protein